MLNLLKFKNSENFLVKKNNYINKNKYYPSIVQEWNNSIYCYNKIVYKNLPIIDKTVNRLIRNFFNLTFILKNKILSFRKRIRLKRISTSRIFISKALIKQTNNKIIILIFAYNREKNFLLKKLKKLYVKNKYKNIYMTKKKLLFEHKIKRIKDKNIVLLNKLKKKINIEKFLILNNIKKQMFNLTSINNNAKYFYVIYNDIFKQNKMIFFYKKLLLLNTYKFKYFFLLNLIRFICKIYKKKVNLKIINLKKLYLSSDILLQSISIKIKNRNNNLSKVLKKAFLLVKLPVLNKYLLFNYKSKKLDFKLTKLNNFFFFNKKKLFKTIQANSIKKLVFESINCKYINGIKLESKGRLTKRLTAQRSIYKSRYKGNIKNIDSINYIPTVVLKGYTKSNLQYTNINSKNRNGSFGLKGWISSY